MNHSRDERVTGTDGILHRHPESRMLNRFISGNDDAPSTPARHGQQP